MNQLTIRGFDPELERRLRTLARQKGVSLSKAALHFMRRGAGLKTGEAEPEVIGDALDAFIGSWSSGDERQLLDATRAFETVDRELWQ